MNKVGSESEKGNKEKKGCGDKQRGEKREKFKEIRREEQEVGEVYRVGENGEAEMEKYREEITREVLILSV